MEDAGGLGRIKTLPRWGSQCKCPEMNVISSNIAANADDTAIGEMLCCDKYSKLSTLVPSISTISLHPSE